MLKLIFVAVALLVAQTASAQTCQLKLDCGGEQPTTNPETVVTRGKQGPRGIRGPKGEMGLPGPNNTEVLARYEERLSYLESLVKNQTDKLNQISINFQEKSQQKLNEIRGKNAV